MKRFVSALVLSIFGFPFLYAQKSAAPTTFFPMTPGTYWVYKGTVRWYDFETDKPVSGDVTWKMTIERVIRKPGVVAAVVIGFPADLDWSAGTTEPKPWLILEDEKHHLFYENLGPDFDLSKFNNGDHVFDKFMVDETFFFQWPLHKGAKFCDDEAKKRDDEMYCWIVTEATRKKLPSVTGAPPDDQPIFQFTYRSLPDDTTMELVPGIGLLSYEYHHHGSVADTELQLVEFHPVPESSDVQGPKP
jgi:hypothetical protein